MKVYQKERSRMTLVKAMLAMGLNKMAAICCNTCVIVVF